MLWAAEGKGWGWGKYLGVPLSATQPPYAQESQCSLFWSSFKLRNTKVLSSNLSSQGLAWPGLWGGEVPLSDHVGLEDFLISLGLLEACKRVEKGTKSHLPAWIWLGRHKEHPWVHHWQGPGCVQCRETHSLMSQLCWG